MANLNCTQLVTLFRPIVEPFYQSPTRSNRVHGIQFYPSDGPPSKAFILCTVNNKILMCSVDAQGNCSEGVELPGSNNLGFPIGMKRNSNNMLYTTNYKAALYDTPNLVCFDPSLTTPTITPVNITYPVGIDSSCIQGANGGTCLTDADTGISYIYVNSCDNSKVIKAVFTDDYNIVVVDVIDMEVFSTRHPPTSRNKAGPVESFPWPGPTSPDSPTELGITNRLSSQIVRLNLKNNTVTKVFATADNGLYYPPFAMPNSYDQNKFDYVLVSNNSFANRSNIPKLIKYNREGKRLPFIPICVMNYYFKEVRQALIYQGYYYIASGSPTGGSPAPGGTIFRINIRKLNRLLRTLYGNLRG